MHVPFYLLPHFSNLFASVGFAFAYVVLYDGNLNFGTSSARSLDVTLKNESIPEIPVARSPVTKVHFD